MQRKLTVIFSADVVGYSGLMERDEAGTLTRLKENRRALFDPAVATHGGRIFKLMGDGVLIEFPSAVSAVNCAVEIQRGMEAAEPAIAEGEKLRYRIGINIGDVIVEGDDIYGDGVNVAARIQALAPVGGVAVARNVSDQVAGKAPVQFDDLGEHQVKNIERPVHVFTVRGIESGEASPAPAKPAKENKIAICVLPFANMSGESEQEYFADGISEDIITDLSRVSALAVISRNSAFMYKGKHVDLPKVARELKVSHVLEGSVRKSGHRVRITAQLINGATNDHIWAERYDRDLSDIFAVQDEISEAIVRALKVRLLPEEKKAIERRGTENVEAWSLVAEARQYLLGGRTGERYFRAVIRFCERALALDPNFAEAWATIAHARDRLHFDCGFADESGFDAACRALELDDKLSLAYAAKARTYNREGKSAEAEAMIAKALELDPDRPEIVKARGVIYFRQRKFREALGWYERAALLEPADFSSPGMMNTCAAALGDQDALERSARMTIERAEPVLAREPDNTDAMGWLVPGLMVFKQTERMNYWINRALMFDPGNFSMSYNFACALSRIGAQDRAMELLTSVKGVFTPDSFRWLKADPDLDGLRDHPAYLALCAELEAKIKTGER